MKDKRTATQPVHLFALVKRKGEKERRKEVERAMGEGEKQTVRKKRKK